MKLKNDTRSVRFLRVYGMAFRHYSKLFLKQGRRCAICKKKSANPTLEDSKPFDLFVDHCHRRGKVRGLICGPCNSMLGFARDNVDTLQNAIAYLQIAASDSSVFDGIEMPDKYRESVNGVKG